MIVLKDEILEKLIYFTEEEMNNLNGMETYYRLL